MKKEGLMDQVLEELLEPLRAVPNVYQALLEASPEELAEFHRGWALKLQAAESLSKGMGAFKTQTETKQTRVSLLAYAGQPGALPPAEPETIDGSIVPPALPPGPTPSAPDDYPPA